ncbi:MAG: hypothetical protein HY040_08435 [Planctomycetes bacterium]|nr:hypothetical protein [Planctomycetota bacterium]
MVGTADQAAQGFESDVVRPRPLKDFHRLPRRLSWIESLDRQFEDSLRLAFQSIQPFVEQHSLGNEGNRGGSG